MKTYCFNYSVEGILTFLPVFICVEGTTQFKAWRRARKYLLHENAPKKAKVWFKNYPDMVDHEFQSSNVPANWQG